MIPESEIYFDLFCQKEIIVLNRKKQFLHFLRKLHLANKQTKNEKLF